MDQGFENSCKTAIVSTSTEVGQLIQEELRKAKVHVKLEAAGGDVGCDLASGSRRRVSLQKYRMQKVKSASKMVSALSKKCKSYRKLVFTGIRSGMYVFSVLGAAPSTTRAARTAIGATLGC